MVKHLLGITVFTASLWAQGTPGEVTGPMLGLVFDRAAHGVRPILGIPASSMLGDRFPADLDFAAASAERSYAVGAETGTGASIMISAAGRQALPVRSGATRIAISPRGSAAAFYFDASKTAQIVTGLPQAPQVAREAALEATPSALAVSDDGEVLLAAVNDAVIAWRNGQASQVSFGAAGVVAIEFFPGSRDALVADEAGNAVWLLRNGGAQVSLLAGERDEIVAPVGAAASSDGARAVIALRSGRVAIRDLASGVQTFVSCDCAPDGLARLRGNAVFRLNAIGEAPLWLLDADGPAPRIVFVAAIPRSDP